MKINHKQTIWKALYTIFGQHENYVYLQSSSIKILPANISGVCVACCTNNGNVDNIFPGVNYTFLHKRQMFLPSPVHQSQTEQHFI